MIFIATGKTGHGKSAYCATICRKALRNKERVYTNTTLNPEAMFSRKKFKKLFGDFPENVKVWGDISKQEDRDNPKLKILYWQNFSDWQYMKEGLVFCDEGLIYFNARNWENLPSNIQRKFVQHRKDKLDLLVNVQHYTFIDKTLRLLCEKFINLELKIGSAQMKKSIIPRISKAVQIDLPTLNRCENLGIDPYNPTEEERDKYNLKTSSRLFWIRPSIFKFYDTGKQMIESRPEPFMHLQRFCEVNGCGYQTIRHT